MSRTEEIFWSRRTESLSTTGARAVRIDKLEVHRVVVCILRYACANSTRGNSSEPTVVDREPNGGGGSVTVRGTTLEQPPTQANGGGFNSSMSSSAVTLAAPLNNGSSINLRFLFGVQQEGKYNFCAVIETLPFTNSAVSCFSGGTLPASSVGDDTDPIQ